MFYPDTFEYWLHPDAYIYGGGIVWPFAEILGTCAASLWGLYCIWLMRGPGHWFVRLLPTIPLLCCLLWIPAMDLGVVLLIQTAVVVVGITVQRPSVRRFALRDLMLTVLIVSIVCAFLTAVLRHLWARWPSFLWYGGGFGLFTLFADFVASRNWPIPIRLLAALVIPFSVIMVIGLLLARMVAQQQGNWPRICLAGLLACLMAPVAWSLAILMWRAPIPKEVAFERNGLSALCEAGNQIPPGVQFRKLPTTEAGLAQVVQSTAEQVEMARAAMALPCRLSVDYELATPARFNDRVPHRPPFISLCSAFLAEARLSEKQHRINDALDRHLDVLNLCQCFGTGGLPFDTSLAMEMHELSLAEIYALRDKMTTPQREEWIDRLNGQEDAFESMSVLWKRRRAWEDRVLTWQDRLVLRFLSARGFSPVRGTMYHTGYKLRLRLLRISLALLNYQADHGSLPQTLDQLVPDYLTELPIDPVSSQQFRYRLTDQGQILYSIGFDGVDDGGTLAPPPRYFTTGDLTAAVMLAQ